MSISAYLDDHVLDTSQPALQARNQQPTLRDEFLSLLGKALDQQVADILIEPGSNQDNFRTDGMLTLHRTLTGDKAQRYVNLLADAAGIPQHRLRNYPENGTLSIKHKGKLLEASAAFVPTVAGIAAIVRLSRNAPRELDEIGFEPEQSQAIKQALASAQGLILIAGPTGSGKSTTAEACLRHLEANRSLKVFEIGDPVEFKNANRSQIALTKEITWKSALQAALDFRADIIFAGEIRTAEQAKQVFEAALRAPLVVCTFHARDIATTINRLQRMGVESYQMAATLSLVIAQELRRGLCQQCKSADEAQVARAATCQNCSGTGRTGLTMIAEVLPVTPEISAQIERHAPGERIMRQAVSKDGVLTIEEIERRKAAAGLIPPRPQAPGSEAADESARVE
jgi:type II secretory ATPase GspE/PulE/Tfp pilus assembly ATPase PilB-like protein